MTTTSAVSGSASDLTAAIEPLKKCLEAKGAAQAVPQDLSDPLAVLPDAVDVERLRDHVVLVGYGRVGRVLAEELTARGLPFVAVETQRDLVEDLRGLGQPAVLGDAQRPEVLVQAHLHHARLLVVAAPDLLAVRGIATTAKALRPGIRILLRTHSADEAEMLAGAGLERGEERAARGGRRALLVGRRAVGGGDADGLDEVGHGLPFRRARRPRRAGRRGCRAVGVG